MIVTVTVNGKTTTHNLNYEKNKATLCLSEYGTYTIRLVDSMGTETVKIYKLEKKMNTSALLLIGLSSFIVVVIVLFVLKARAKIPTR